MATVNIHPISSINGEVNAPPSKSYSHRAFVAASLADGVSIIKNPLIYGDVAVTIDLLKELNINVRQETGNTFLIQKTKNSYKSVFCLLSPLDIISSSSCFISSKVLGDSILLLIAFS